LPRTRAHDRPLFLGEFGTSNNADMASRVRWTRFNRQLAERHGFSWGCWCLGPLFALYDGEHGRWHAGLLEALMS
jgi:endoglucanase